MGLKPLIVPNSKELIVHILSSLYHHKLLFCTLYVFLIAV